MKNLILVLYVIYAVAYVAGCAYKGDVFIYSPQGDANAIEKATNAEAEVSLIP